jgi:hypothetical protein
MAIPTISMTCYILHELPLSFVIHHITFNRNNYAFITGELPALHEESVCGEPCPGDCVMSQWSDFGDCFDYCKQGEKRGIQIRSR